MSSLGSHKLHIDARMELYPSVKTQSSIELPINFVRCPIEIVGFEISDIEIPALIRATQQFEEP